MLEKLSLDKLIERTQLAVVVIGVFILIVGAVGGLPIGNPPLQITDPTWRWSLGVMGLILISVGLLLLIREEIGNKQKASSNAFLQKLTGRLMITMLLVASLLTYCVTTNTSSTATVNDNEQDNYNTNDSEEQPPFGATESVSVAAPPGNTIYVSTAGDDVSGDGSLANPFRTIEHALSTAAAGDEIVLRGAPALTNNVYAEAVRIRLPNITIRSQTGEWAVIQCPTNDENIDVCVHFDTDTDPAQDSSGSRLQRVEIMGGYYYGIKFETRWDWGDPNDRNGASDILIEDVIVHDTGNAAIKVTPGCDGITIRRVEVYNTGLTVRPDSAEGIDNVNGDRMVVQDSYFHDIAGTGLYFKGGAMDVLIERNRIEHTGAACPDDDPCGGGIFIGFDTSPEFFDLTVNPDYYESIRGVVRNNLIRDTQLAGIGLYAAKDAQVWNNTLIDTARAAHSPIYFGITFQDWDPNAGRPPSVNPIIRNNLIYQSSGLPMECVAIRYTDELGGLAGLADMPTMDYNLYYHAGGNCTFTDLRPASLLEQGTFTQWQTHISDDTHSLTANPQIATDGHLLVGSPAIDAGTCAGAPPDDFDGDLRPQGATCDIGADEFASGFDYSLYCPIIYR